MADSFSGIQALLDSYCDAFRRFDADGVADHVAYPAHISSDAAEILLIAIADREACVEAMSRVINMHRQLGVSAGIIHDLQVTELSPRLAQAALRMEVLGPDGQPLYDFDSSYTAAKVGDRWLIVAIAHNQIPRLLACMARN